MSRHGLPIKQHTHVGINQGGDLVFPAPPAPPPPPGCGHKHITETFTATGGVDTFTLAFAPLWDRRVYVSGARVTPAAVTVAGRSVTLDTSSLIGSSYDTVIDYETSCFGKLPVPPPSTGGALALPGADVAHGIWANELATIVTTGAAYLRLDITDGGAVFDGNDLVIVDNAGTSTTDWYGFSTSGFDHVYPTAVGVFYLPIPAAGTWYIVTGGVYDPTLDGAATYTIVYPSTPTGSLAFPGVNDDDANHGNKIATIVTAGDSIIFLTITAPLPTSSYLGLILTGFDDDHYVNPDVAAGTYVFRVTADTWKAYAATFTSYDAGLTNTGTYEVIAL